ncbi:MAG: LPS export ABC transporter periplasmic protein LptC [candidate division WOR-3 bacterium]
MILRNPLLFVALGAMLSCSRERSGEPSAFPGNESAEGVRILQTDKGRRLWELFADSMEIIGDTVKVKGVNLKFYGKRGEVQSTLTSDSGRYYQSSEDMSAHGRVEVKGQDGSYLSTSSLFYSRTREEIFTEERVYLRTRDKEVWGKGLTSDPALTRIEIKEEVWGKGQEEEWQR